MYLPSGKKQLGAKQKGNDIAMGTWNVRTLIREGALQETIREMEKEGLAILALQEIRWKGQGEHSKNGHTLYFSGTNDNSSKYGTGFLVNNQLKKSILGFYPINERMCKLKIKSRFNNLSIINVYAPTEDSEDNEKELMYNLLEEECNGISTYDTKIIMGDFNAKIGVEDFTKTIAGQHSLHKTTSENGLRMCQLASACGLYIISTHFEHKDIHKGTWIIPGTNRANQIDHILISKNRISSIRDVHVCRSRTVDSDHFLVKTYLRQKITNAHTNNTYKTLKYDTSKLKDPNTSEKFREMVEEELESNYASHTQNVDDQWNILKNSITNAATLSIKATKTNPKDWFDEECKATIDEKNQLRVIMMEQFTTINIEKYKAKRSEARKLCKKKKKEHINNKIKKITANHNVRDMKEFYRSIGKQTKRSQPIIKACKDADGKILAESEDIMNRWGNYFENLYNIEIREEARELECADHEVANVTVEPNQQMELDNELTDEEIEEAIHAMKEDKAPGGDGIPGVLFKHLGVNGQVMLTSIIKSIWTEEKMPNEWRTGVIVPLHKKGDKLICENYRGITLLDAGYKIFSYILSKKLRKAAETVLSEYQGGFRPGRGTADQVFLLKQNLEKCYEHNMDVHMLFIDFKQAFDSINRKKIWTALRSFGISEKLIRLVKETLTETKGRVRIHNQLTDAFEVTSGVKQGDALSTTVFNIVLHFALCKIARTGHLFSKSSIMIAYADDIAILAKSKKFLLELFTQIDIATKQLGLKVNEEKTKYMLVSKDGNKRTVTNLLADGYNFEGVDRFKYLGVLITNTNESRDCINDRIIAANRAFYANVKLIKSKLVSKAAKLAIYKTLIRPVLTYSAEVWTLTSNEEKTIATFERKILRKIFGPVKEHGVYRRRYNHELLALSGNECAVKFIKALRLRWAGHIIRMSEERPQKQLMLYNPIYNRAKGRPRMRWIDDVIEDVRRMGVENWMSKVKDREVWRKVVEETKTHKELNTY